MSVSDFINKKPPDFANSVEGYYIAQFSHDVDARLSSKQEKSLLPKEEKKNFITMHIAQKKHIPAPNAYAIKITPRKNKKIYCFDRTTYLSEI